MNSNLMLFTNFSAFVSSFFDSVEKLREIYNGTQFMRENKRMSLKSFFPSEVPELTRHVVESLLGEDSVYRLIGTEVNKMLKDEDFASMYACEGRSGINPVVLVLVTVFQFIEKLPDRQAAQMAVMRLDWKYALHQDLDWQGFHYSDLCIFRKRLLAYGKESYVFEQVIAYLSQRGYLKNSVRQRTDSTHIFGAVRDLSNLELVQETIRLALSALISTNAPWVIHSIPQVFVTTYTRTQRLDWKGQSALVEDLQKVAVDGEWLFAQVMQHGDKALRQLPELQTLRRVLNERFTKDKNSFTYTPTGHYRGSFVATPHDLDVQRSVKGSRQWVGYKVHVTETIANADEPHFITDIQTSTASQTDNQALDTVQDKLIQRQLVPRQHYVDQGYMSASNVADSQRLGIDLRGRLMPDTSGKPIGFQLEDFHVNIEQQTATCPAGQQAERFIVSKPNPRNLVAYHVFFGKQCQTCIFFGPGYCTDRPGGRHLSVSLYHDLIQERRREQRTDAFQKEMQTRAGVESLISELVRGHAMRRARYRGRAKVHLQMLFTGAAANLKRLAQASKLLFQQLFTRYHFPIRETHGFSVSII